MVGKNLHVCVCLLLSHVRFLFPFPSLFSYLLSPTSCMLGFDSQPLQVHAAEESAPQLRTVHPPWTGGIRFGM